MDDPNPEMLVLAREAAGLTQTELAKAMGVTQAKVSRYESGIGKIPDDHIARLSEVVDRPASFFYWDESVYGASCLFHRKRKTAGIRETRRIHAIVNICRMQASRMLSQMRVRGNYSFHRLDMTRCGGASNVARKIRHLWQLPRGPIRNVVSTIERAGGIVFSCYFRSEKIDGISQWPLDVDGFPPVFFINDQIPGDRGRWTLAHEIGHVLMHHLPTAIPENEADEFAGEFLMPADDISQDLSGMTLPKAAALKSHWKTSMQAIINRAWYLEKITDNQRKHLFQQMSVKKYKKCEPVPIPSEEARLLPDLVSACKRKLKMGRIEMDDWLGNPGENHTRIEVLRDDLVRLAM